MEEELKRDNSDEFINFWLLLLINVIVSALTAFSVCLYSALPKSKKTQEKKELKALGRKVSNAEKTSYVIKPTFYYPEITSFFPNLLNGQLTSPEVNNNEYARSNQNIQRYGYKNFGSNLLNKDGNNRVHYRKKPANVRSKSIKKTPAPPRPPVPPRKRFHSEISRPNPSARLEEWILQTGWSHENALFPLRFPISHKDSTNRHLSKSLNDVRLENDLPDFNGRIMIKFHETI